MSKGKDFRAPRKRGFDDDGPMPYESRPRPSRRFDSGLDVFGIGEYVVVVQEWFYDVERGLWQPPPCKVDHIGKEMRYALFVLRQHGRPRI